MPRQPLQPGQTALSPVSGRLIARGLDGRYSLRLSGRWEPVCAAVAREELPSWAPLIGPDGGLLLIS